MRARQLAPAAGMSLVLVFGAGGCGDSGAEAAGVANPDAFDASGGGGAPGQPGTLVAFVGAEGFGSQARGGRGGSVCHVTTLDDAGAGSLRDCVSAPNRTVVFDVSGWITLASELPVLVEGLTIAGQTAPGQGVGVRGNKLAIGGRNIIVRFLRARRGILTNTTRDDALTITPSGVDVIVDHCSVAFGTDETLSIPGDTPSGPSNVTLQWSIVAWGLQRNNHSAGSLLAANRTSVHHTLWAFNKTRNPRARSSQAATGGDTPLLDWVNNVTAGWDARDPVGEQNGWSLSHHPFIMGGTESGTHYANAVGNYFVSSRAVSYAFVEGTPNSHPEADRQGNVTGLG